MAAEYKLSKLIKVHTDAVRDMALYEDVSGAPKLVTVSRDCDAKIFSIIGGTVADRPDLTFSDAVPMSSVTTMPADRSGSGTAPMLFFGCLNGAIFVHLDKEVTPLNVLTFHSQNVGALRVDASSKLLATGSWDNSAIVYDIAGENVRFKILSHTHPVNDVAFLRPPLAQGRLCLLTASSDKSIVLWDISSTDTTSFGGSPAQLRSFMGHEDCVRSVLLNPEMDSFYSVSNDQLIKCWNVTTGEPTSTLAGHLHFIYKVVGLKNKGLMATCGEDRTIRIWSMNTSTEVQTIHLPVVSIWNIISLTESTLVAACSDGRLYVLTTDPSMVATAEQMVLLQQLIAKQNLIPFQEVTHLRLYEQYTLESIPAKSPGEKRLIRVLEDDSVVLFEAEADLKSWSPLGMVKEYVHQDIVDGRGRLWFNGDYYDAIVPVTLHGIKYRLACNRALDPWHVGADFIAFHHLEQTDLPVIVKAIVSSVKYTAASKQPGQDVFSDASELPITTMVLFDAPPNWEKFKAKFKEFHDGLLNEELKLPQGAFEVVNASFNDPGRQCDVFVQCYERLLNWPNNLRFLVYDLFRLNLANPYFASYMLHHMNSFGSIHFESLLAQTKIKDLPLQLTSLRCLTNLFSTVHGAEFMYTHWELVSQMIVPWSGLVDNRNIHLAYAGIWFNYSVLLVDEKKRLNTSFMNGLLGTIADGDGVVNVEALGTLVNAFGNLLVAGGGKTWTEEIPLAKEFLAKVLAYPKKYEGAYEVRRAVQQINRL